MFSARAIGAGSLTVGAAGLGAAIGALPLPAAAILAVGLPTLVLSVAVPRVTFVLLMFSIPFSSWTKVSVGAFDVTSTDVLVGILIGSWLIRSVMQHRIDLHGGPMVGMALLLLGAEILSSTTARSFPSALKEVLKLGELIALAIYGASVFRGTRHIRLVVWALLAAGACESAVGLFQFVTARGPAAFAIGPFIRAYGDFQQPNAFAGYLAMILPFGILWSITTDRYRALAIGLTITLAVGLVASMSRGAWLGTMVGIAAMALVWTRQARRIIAAGVAGLALLLIGARFGVIPPAIASRVTVLLDNYWVFDARTVQPDAANWAIVERMAHWQAGWHMATAYPITGVGPGNYEAAYEDFSLPGWADALGHAHNLYINMFAELGIIGFLVFVAFTAAIFARVLLALRLSALASAMPVNEARIRRTVLIAALGAASTFSIHNTFDNMFIHGMGVQFGLILGLVEAQFAAFNAARLPKTPPAGELPFADG